MLLGVLLDVSTINEPCVVRVCYSHLGQELYYLAYLEEPQSSAIEIFESKTKTCFI